MQVGHSQTHLLAHCYQMHDSQLPSSLLCGAMSDAYSFPWEATCSTITRERLTQPKSWRVFCPLSGLDWSVLAGNEKKTRGSGLCISIALECWRKSSVLPSHNLPPSMKFRFNTSVSEGLHTSSCHLLGLWVEANFNCWIMNTGLLERKEGRNWESKAIDKLHKL